MSEGWLSDETFDFSLGSSPCTDNDEEVFTGKVSHKEKCVASIVREKEELLRSIEQIKPEEQVVLLRESALLNMRIRERGTPSSGNTAVKYCRKSQDVYLSIRNEENDKENEAIIEAIIVKAIIEEERDKGNSPLVKPRGKLTNTVENEKVSISKPNTLSRSNTKELNGSGKIDQKNNPQEKKSNQKQLSRSGLPTIQKSTNIKSKNSFQPAPNCNVRSTGNTYSNNHANTFKAVAQSKLRLAAPNCNVKSTGTASSNHVKTSKPVTVPGVAQSKLQLKPLKKEIRPKNILTDLKTKPLQEQPLSGKRTPLLGSTTGHRKTENNTKTENKDTPINSSVKPNTGRRQLIPPQTKKYATTKQKVSKRNDKSLEQLELEEIKSSDRD